MHDDVNPGPPPHAVRDEQLHRRPVRPADRSQGTIEWPRREAFVRPRRLGHGGRVLRGGRRLAAGHTYNEGAEQWTGAARNATCGEHWRMDLGRYAAGYGSGEGLTSHS